jgi:2-polyprenyl-3-methyl-5-hydroxy-6-metoxy-1,4-benzoquinol methylase
MWAKYLSKLSPRARRNAFRASITRDVLAELTKQISVAKTDEFGRPNLHPINMAVTDLDWTNLNLKYFGYDLARSLAAALPANRETEARHVGLQSKASTQTDMESDWVAYWCSQLHTPVVFHRKLWELSYVLQAIYEHGQLREGARGLGFGCGQEPIPSYLAAHGVSVTITDLEPDEAAAAGWAQTNQHAASLDNAYQPHLVSRERFDALVDLRYVDMNAIPTDLTGYDFCWSICALEHLGSIAKGLDFIENSLATLRPGGISVHTTEFNIAATGPTLDNWPTVLFQGAHFTAVAERLRAQGHEVAELNFDLGDKPMDRFIDLPPWQHGMADDLAKWHGEPYHLKIALGGFASTCFGILVRKAG